MVKKVCCADMVNRSEYDAACAIFACVRRGALHRKCVTQVEQTCVRVHVCVPMCVCARVRVYVRRLACTTLQSTYGARSSTVCHVL